MGSFEPPPNPYEGLPLLELPFVVLRNVASYLRLSELKNLEDVFPDSTIGLLFNEAELKLKRSVDIRNDFRWSRYMGAFGEVSPRVGQALAYHEDDNAVYTFGGQAHSESFERRDDSGRVIESGNACFSDLWKLDLASMQYSRVLVTSPPYPQPKYNAAMLVYKNELLLYGGLPEQSRQVMTNTNEVHLFNTTTCKWRQLVTLNDGPSLSGHSMTLCGDRLIVYGGHLTKQLANTTFWVLDLSGSRVWSCPEIPGIPSTLLSGAVHQGEFPIYEVGTTSLITLADNSVLLLGELERTTFTTNYGVIVTFDGANPSTTAAWSWRRIEVTGKWWDAPQLGSIRPGPARPSNCKFPKVVALRTRHTIRLVTAGFLQHSNPFQTARMVAELEARMKRVRGFVEFVTGIITSEMERRDLAYRYCNDNEDSGDLHTVIKDDGIVCSIQHCYLERQDIIAAKRLQGMLKPRTMDKVNCVLWIDPYHESQILIPLDDVDKNLMHEALLKAIYKLHVKHYTSYQYRIRSNSTSAPPSKNRLVSYTAELRIGPNWSPDDIKEIKYTPGSSYSRTPTHTLGYSLCAAGNEVVFHGGVAYGDNSNNFAPVPAHTYLMIPADRPIAEEDTRLVL